MTDKNKRAIIEENVKQFNERAAKHHASRATYVAHEDLPTGERTIVTTVLHELGCAGVGHAIQAPGDLFEAEVATLLSLGRAYQVLGKRMVERGLAVSKDLDGISKLAERVADEFCAKVWPVMNPAQRAVHHEKRLEDAIKSGAVIECVLCNKAFGTKGKRTRLLKVQAMPHGMKRRSVRTHHCPHCRRHFLNPADMAKVENAIGEFKQVEARRKLLKAMCDACSVDECPGPDKDPCDEAKGVLESKTEPGRIHIPTLQKAIDGLPPSGGIIDGETPRGDDGELLPFGTIPKDAGEHVCGGRLLFDHYEQSKLSEGPVYKCDKCGEYQIIYPKG